MLSAVSRAITGTGLVSLQEVTKHNKESRIVIYCFISI
jgi:hypothetical protein